MLKICSSGHLTGYRVCPQCDAAAAPSRLPEGTRPILTVGYGDRRQKKFLHSRFARWIAGPGFIAQEAAKLSRQTVSRQTECSA